MPSASFASKLDEALIASPYSLERIVDILSRQGLQVSQATLSHWRLGRSVPKRRNSLRIVAALEDLLGLPAHNLSSLLPRDLTKNIDAPPPESGKEPQPINSDYTSVFDESDNQTDWSREIQRELLEKETIISSDFLSSTHTFTILARVPQVKNPCLHISIGITPTDVIPPTKYVEIYNVKGATIGERKIYGDGRATVTRLDLPNSCYPGQLHRISYTYSYQSTVPLKKSSTQAFAWPLRFYINRVEFEGKVPERIEWVEENAHDEDDVTYTSILTHPIVPIGNTIQVCIEKPTAKCGYFRWE